MCWGNQRDSLCYQGASSQLERQMHKKLIIIKCSYSKDRIIRPGCTGREVFFKNKQTQRTIGNTPFPSTLSVASIFSFYELLLPINIVRLKILLEGNWVRYICKKDPSIGYQSLPQILSDTNIYLFKNI